MLLEIDNSELLNMLDNEKALSAKVEEAVSVLNVHMVRWHFLIITISIVKLSYILTEFR